MDAGDVELSGAVDFDPNEEPNNTEESVETAKSVASVKEEDVRFHANDIREKQDMFVNVEGGERRRREEERRKKQEQKESLREAERADREVRNRALQEVAESEKRIQAEQRKLALEQHMHKHRMRLRQVGAWAKKHWYIIAAVVIIAAGSVTYVIVSDIMQKQRQEAEAIENEKYVKEHKSAILRIFTEIVGKELSKRQIAEVLAKYKDADVAVEYYPQAATIHSSDYKEAISAVPLVTDGDVFINFAYDFEGTKTAHLIKEYDGYKYFWGDDEHTYASIDEAIDAYLVDTKDEQR